MSYRHPADIDGEPAEVAAQALVSLADITQAAYETASATYVLARNAALDAVPELSGDAVVEWEESVEGRALRALTRATENAHKAARGLARRHEREVGSATVLG